MPATRHKWGSAGTVISPVVSLNLPAASMTPRFPSGNEQQTRPAEAVVPLLTGKGSSEMQPRCNSTA